MIGVWAEIEGEDADAVGWGADQHGSHASSECGVGVVYLLNVADVFDGDLHP